MFDFQKLDVYKKSKEFNKIVREFICRNKIDKITNNQLRRASFSIMLNIAEGTSRFSNRDRKNFFVISRGSVFECVAIFEYLCDNGVITGEQYSSFYIRLEELSKMLFALIRKYT